MFILDIASWQGFVLHAYRLRWMPRVLERENRIADTVVTGRELP